MRVGTGEISWAVVRFRSRDNLYGTTNLCRLSNRSVETPQSINDTDWTATGTAGRLLLAPAPRHASHRRAGVGLNDVRRIQRAGGLADDFRDAGGRELRVLLQQQGGDAGDLRGGEGAAGEEVVGALGH